MAKCSSRKTCALISDLLDANALNCKSCKKPLKTPVLLVDNVGNVCEECTKLNKWTGTPNELFEVLLRNLNYQCSYVFWGCIEEVPVAQHDQHLKSCKYRRVKCPHQSCTWTGRQDALAEHFEKDHVEDVISDGETFSFWLDLSIPSLLTIKLLIKRNAKYFLIVKRDKEVDKVTCKLLACRFVKGITSSIEFSPEPAFDAPQLRFNVVVKELNSIDEDFCGREMNLTAFEQFLNDKHSLYITVNVPPDEQLMKSLECPICLDTMKPPMYQCAIGHTICNTCVEQSQNCPTCKTVFGKKVRNYALEKLSYDVLYFCRYKAEGCEVAHLGGEIMDHESVCNYHSYKCPLPNCTYTYNSKNVLNHLSLKHKDVTNMFESNIDTKTNKIAGACPWHMFINGIFFSCYYTYINDYSNYNRTLPQWRFEFQQLSFDKKLNNVYYCKLTFDNSETQSQFNYVQPITKFENRCTFNVPTSSCDFLGGTKQEIRVKCEIFLK